MKCMTELGKRIDELDKKIDNLQYQTDDVLNHIDIVHHIVIDNYVLLSRMKDENKNS